MYLLETVFEAEHPGAVAVAATTMLEEYIARRRRADAHNLRGPLLVIKVLRGSLVEEKVSCKWHVVCRPRQVLENEYLVQGNFDRCVCGEVIYASFGNPFSAAS